MKNEYEIDLHKLHYHPCRMCKWMKGEVVYPLYAEVSPTNKCNHNCVFCGPNFARGNEFLDTKVWEKLIKSMAKCGVKAIMYGGEGEPLLHKDIAYMIRFTKELGIDVALTTNGVLCNEKRLKQILPYLSWIKFSVDALYPSTYSILHGTKEKDLLTLMNNIKKATHIRDKNKYDCVIGTQAILFKENWEQMYALVPQLKALGVDYFVLKPFSEHSNRKGDKISAPEYPPDDLENWNDDDFTVIVREHAFCDLNEPREYDDCYAQDFMAYIDTTGGVYSCINYLGDDNYCYGNIYENSFKTIWKNKKWITPDLDNCRTVCRLDLANQYLWKLKHEPRHKNFI